MFVNPKQNKAPRDLILAVL